MTAAAACVSGPAFVPRLPPFGRPRTGRTPRAFPNSRGGAHRPPVLRSRGSAVIPLESALHFPTGRPPAAHGSRFPWPERVLNPAERGKPAAYSGGRR